MKHIFKIKGIDCANCAAELERKIQKIDGVESASISFISEKMILEINKNEVETLKKILKLIKKEEPDTTVKEI